MLTFSAFLKLVMRTTLLHNFVLRWATTAIFPVSTIGIINNTIGCIGENFGNAAGRGGGQIQVKEVHSFTSNNKRKKIKQISAVATVVAKKPSM